jgi:hypothetical protein
MTDRDDNRFLLTLTSSKFQISKEGQQATPDGKKVSVIKEETVYSAEVIPFQDVRVLDTTGKKLTAAEAEKLLANPMAAVVARGETVDPFYLKAVKDGTPVVLLPAIAAHFGVSVGAPAVVPASPPPAKKAAPPSKDS